MGSEVERKFLLINEDWRNTVTHSEQFQDGLIARFGGGKLRVRLAPERAWITIKGARNGISRSEFEYEIPIDDAQEMLATLCDGPIVEKTRYCAPYGGLIWSVDVHSGALEGVIFAEVELSAENQSIDLPPHGRSCSARRYPSSPSTGPPAATSQSAETGWSSGA